MNEQDSDQPAANAGQRRSWFGQFRREPRWVKILMAVFVFAVIGGVASWFVRMEPKHGNVVKFGDGGVYYKHPVTEAQARRVGEILTREHVYPEDPALVQLRRAGNGYELRTSTQFGGQDVPQFAAFWRGIAAMVSIEVFRGAPCAMLFCDDAFEPIP